MRVTYVEEELVLLGKFSRRAGTGTGTGTSSRCGDRFDLGVDFAVVRIHRDVQEAELVDSLHDHPEISTFTEW